MLFLSYLITALHYLIDLVSLLILVRALVSWLPLREDNPIIVILNVMTEPVVAPVRNLLSHISILRELPVDFSPFFALIALMILNSLLNLFYI